MKIAIKMKKNMTGQVGFTVMELMIVVGIIGIVTALTIPAYLSWRPGYQYRGAVSQVQRDLNRAKLRTYETRRQCRVEFCGDGVTYQLIDGDLPTGSTWTTHLSCPMTAAEQAVYTAAGRRVTIRGLVDYPGVTIAPATQPTFSPRGTATVGALAVNHPKFPGADVAVNMTGRVNITWK